jgi:hypothetical protein
LTFSILGMLSRHLVSCLRWLLAMLGVLRSHVLCVLVCIGCRGLCSSSRVCL